MGTAGRLFRGSSWLRSFCLGKKMTNIRSKTNQVFLPYPLPLVSSLTPLYLCCASSSVITFEMPLTNSENSELAKNTPFQYDRNGSLTRPSADAVPIAEKPLATTLASESLADKLTTKPGLFITLLLLFSLVEAPPTSRPCSPRRKIAHGRTSGKSL
jgi:hypothetical protein